MWMRRLLWVYDRRRRNVHWVWNARGHVQVFGWWNLSHVRHGPCDGKMRMPNGRSHHTPGHDSSSDGFAAMSRM